MDLVTPTRMRPARPAHPSTAPVDDDAPSAGVTPSITVIILCDPSIPPIDGTPS